MNMEILASKMGAPDDVAEMIERYAIIYGVNDNLERAHFVAQMYVESAGFTRVVENLNYSAEGLLATFGAGRISSKDAWRVGRVDAWGQKADQRAIANIVYGGEWGRRNLGNTKPNDGWDFRGKGYKQVTGRANVEAYRKWSGTTGDLAELPDSVLSGFWYWITNDVGRWAREDNVLKVSQAINLGPGRVGSSITPNGYAERVKATARAKSL